ncbi:MAG TPA: hypothetical protein VJL90_02890, partial [Pseudorhodoplanes sp.]|nr:hypothetical protein [Pseudorhodoplanes sp.]
SRAAALGLMLLASIAAGAPTPVLAQAQSAPQPNASDQPPVSVLGWRYEKGANDVYVFYCEQARCVPGSKVSYRLYANSAPVMSLEEFRRSQEQVVKLLEQRGPAGTKFQILGVEGDNKTDRPALMKSIRLITKADGTQEYGYTGVIMGKKLDASVISSSPDRNAAASNYAQFAAGVAVYAQALPSGAKAPEKKK